MLVMRGLWFGGIPYLPPNWPNWSVGKTGTEGKNDVESVVKAAQDAVSAWLDGRSELARRAMYYRLYSEGQRIPSDPSADLRRCAKAAGA
jgi:hypothetical protein